MYLVFGSDRSPRSQDLVLVCMCLDIPQENIEKQLAKKQASTLEGIHFDEEESEPCPVRACYNKRPFLCLPYQGAGPFCEASRISDPQRLMGADFCPEWSPS